jgi:Xaa-Pro aminopeptidase
MAHLGNSVQVHAPGEFAAALDAMKGKNVLIDPSTAAAAIFDRLTKAGAKIKQGADPCQLPKACKNALEIEGMRKAHIRDGAALARYLGLVRKQCGGRRIDRNPGGRDLGRLSPRYRVLSDVSFDTISGAGSNGAIVHYRVTRSTNRTIRPGEMFLLDSGAQYPDGTTDVTRTIMVGEADAGDARPLHPCLERPYRAGHGAIPRRHHRHAVGLVSPAVPLWEAGLDYDHGTGHGVGSYLSVHEGRRTSPRSR